MFNGPMMYQNFPPSCGCVLQQAGWRTGQDCSGHQDHHGEGDGEGERLSVIIRLGYIVSCRWGSPAATSWRAWRGRPALGSFLARMERVLSTKDLANSVTFVEGSAADFDSLGRVREWLGKIAWRIQISKLWKKASLKIIYVNLFILMLKYSYI